MGDPDAVLSIHRISAKIGAVPTRNTSVRIRIGARVFDIGWIAHDAERDVPAGCENEIADRVFAKIEDRFTIFWRVHIFHQQPRSDERILLANLGGIAYLHPDEKEQSGTIEKPAANGINTNPIMRSGGPERSRAPRWSGSRCGFEEIGWHLRPPVGRADAGHRFEFDMDRPKLWATAGS